MQVIENCKIRFFVLHLLIAKAGGTEPPILLEGGDAMQKAVRHDSE